MAYIGNTVQNQGFTPAIDYFNGNGVTVTFTLSRPIASVAQVIVAVDNVIQNPSSAFNVVGNSITFTSAPLSGTNNIWVEYTSLITTYQGISQDPTVIGDIRATGGYLAEGDFGNSFIDGNLIDYVTGAGRLTVGELDDLVFYHGGTSARSEMMRLSYAGNSTLAGGLTATGAGSFQGVTVGKGTGAVATNTVVGNGALRTNTTGALNAIFGLGAGDSITTGSNNSYFGGYAGAQVASSTGSSNSGFGYFTLASITSGANNTAVGQDSLRSNTTASDNTAVGYQALYTNATGTAVTALGYKAGYASTGSVSVYVGYNCGVAATGSSNTFIGSGAGEGVTSGAANTIVGRYNGNQGGLDIRTSSNNIVLSDGGGNPRWRCDSTGQEFTLIVGVGLYAAYSCRAWANFAGSNGAVSGSGNISSVSRTGTGLYQVNFSTAMPDANYSVCTAVKPTSGQGSTNGKVANIRYDNSLSVNFFVIYTYSNAGAEDFDRVLFSVFR